MADEFTLELDDAATLKALAALPGKGTQTTLRRTLNVIGLEQSRWMATRQFASYTGKSPSHGLQTRTGQLRRSIRHEVRGSSIADLSLRMYVIGRQARIQEYGGDIRPVRARALTIPTPAALTPSGALSGRVRIRKDGSRYTTDLGDTFIFHTKRGEAAIGIKRKRDNVVITVRGGAPKAFYILKHRVHIPPRLGFRSSYMLHTRRFALRALKRAGDEIVANATATGG